VFKLDYLDKLFSSNLFLRVVAVIIACILWFYVTGDRASETVRSIRCPVQYINLPAHTILVNENREVVVQISGERSVFADLDLDKIVCEADLHGLDVGKYKLAVRTTVPGDVTLLDVEPDQVEFELVKYIERSLPVTVKVEEGIPPGLFLESVQMEPKEITIRGEETKVAMVKSLRVEPTLDQLKRGGALELPVKVISEGEEPLDLDLDRDSVTLSAILAQGTPKIAVPVKVQLIGEPQEDFRVDRIIVEPAKIEVEGPASVLNSIQEVLTPLYDISGISDDQQVILPLEPLKDEKVRFVSDPSIMVKVLLKPFTITRQFSGITVSVEGKSIYPSWSVDPVTVAVTVEGKPSDIDELEKDLDLIEAYVNVTNFVSRELTVPVQIRSRDRKIKVVSVLPSTVSVKAGID
jgi:YbbR domain-containing protein